MGVTGYEKLTDEEIEIKLRRVEDIKFNLEREKRHRKEEEEREKHKNIIGKFIRHEDDPNLIVRIDKHDGEKYIGKAIRFSSDAGRYLLPISTNISFSNVYNFAVDDLSEWTPVDKKIVDDMVKEWKKQVDLYIRF